MGTLNFALFGAPPAFDKPLPVGQLYFPSRERYEEQFRGIFARQYYTEYGPLNQELEQKLQQFFGVKHAICVTNATIGLMMLADAMELSGKVILPAFSHIASAQSLTWAGLEPVFCDIDLDNHQIAHDQVSALLDKDVSAIMGVNLWGGACDPKALSALSEAHGVQLYFDSAHSFGCAVEGVPIGNFGRAEVFSFHADNILNATEGGCICTNDDGLAGRLRNMRSSAGAGKPVSVTKTVNGRMSEAQAAIALLNLEYFPANQKHNEALFLQYEKRLEAIPGIYLAKPAGVSFSNYQSVVCEVNESEFGLSRDWLVEVLKAENVGAQRNFYPGLHRSIPYLHELPHFRDHLPNTDNLSASCFQLPAGALVSAQAVDRICDILGNAHHASPAIRSKYAAARIDTA